MPRTLPKLLVVDDELPVVDCISEALTDRAATITGVSNVPQALTALEKDAFDIALCDVYMPETNGLELLAMAQRAHWDMSFIMITGKSNVKDLSTSVRLQAADFLLKPFTIRELITSVERTFERLQAQRRTRHELQSLQDALQRRTLDLELTTRSLEDNYRTTLETLVDALDAREHETCAHSFRVRAYTMHLARLAGYPWSMQSALENAALLHDIGKIAISDAILLKPAKLTPEQFDEVKKHAVIGEQILSHIEFLRPAAKIVRHHHERFDGKGYPDELAADQIPLGARLFAVADTLDAMLSDRCYRKAPGYEAARKEILSCSGTQFDPFVVELAAKIPEDVWYELRRGAEEEARNTNLVSATAAAM
ncbi:MAG TPA: HD domain-containing phosphohydrolase [Terriglobales bacterium]|nr:HD domain-containing phosphohydrolase [Terriglobales bacterium]